MSENTFVKPDEHAGQRETLPLGTPQFISRYELMRELGAGTHGRVFLAFDHILVRYVAIKVPKSPDTRNLYAQFFHEARIISGIHHPNICPVHDAGEDSGYPFIVLMYAEITLKKLIEKTIPSVENTLDYVWQIANGLHAAHQHGVIHRDLKPENILYDRVTGKLLLTDFGIARDENAHQTFTTKGTPLYMPPEQWAPNTSWGIVSPRSDVYSLGVLMYRLLTGHHPFPDDPSQPPLMDRHRYYDALSPSSVRNTLDKRLDELCLRALQKKQHERYNSAEEFAKAIEEYRHRVPITAVRQQSWSLTVAGTWHSRPLGSELTQWHYVAEPPCDIITRADEAYKFAAEHYISDKQLTDIEQFRNLNTFHHLNLNECSNISNAGLARVGGLGSLRCLELEYCSKLTSDGLRHLSALSNLETLRLSGCRGIDDTGLGHLANLVSLKELTLGRCRKITETGLAQLKGLSKLQILDVRDCDDIGDAALTEISGITSLQSLDFSECQLITDVGIASLQSLRQLRSLDLRQCNRIGDSAMSSLSQLTQLQKLFLYGCVQITDDGLEHLAKLTSLQELNLGSCVKITGAGLRHLHTLRTLQTLNLQFCSLIEKRDVAAFKLALPNCEVLR